MNLARYSAWLALGFGPLILGQGIVRHQTWNGWVLADGAACVVLLVGGLWAMRSREEIACRGLTAAWGVTCGGVTLSFLIATPLIDAPQVREVQASWLVVTGWMLVTTLVGLAGAVAGNQNARR